MLSWNEDEGSGKSAISLEIAKIYAGSERLLASFFFFRNSGDRSRMNKFAATLAAQMAAAVPATTTFIQAALDAEPGLLTDGVSLTVQLERLVYAPFQAALEQGLDLSGGPFVIVIDGLDECEDKQGVVNFIDHALNFFKEHPSIPLRLFIASRVEEHIRSRLESEQVILSDLNSHSAHGDIELFLRASFRSAAAKDRVIQSYVRAHGEWPTKLDMAKLIRHIKGSFVLAATIFKFIVQPATEEDPSTPMARLPLALEMNGLDGLYARTLARSQHLPHFHNIISTIALLERPLPIIGIARLLRIEAFEVAHVLLNLQAIIHVPGTDELGEVTLCHTSLLDFLATKSRSGPFFVPPSFHLHLSYYCFASIYEKPAHDYGNHFSLHWRAFAKAGVCDFIDEIEQFKAQACQSQHPVNRLPYHAFLCTLFLYSFSLRHWEIPVGVPYLLTECAEQLALAVEHPDHRIQSWLENQLSAALYFPFIQRMEQLTEDTYGRVKHSLERASNAIYAKFPGILEQHRQPTGRENEYTIGRVLPTGIDIFGNGPWLVLN
ncbi:hypothetical protein MD484_g5872, partial [Candolleomyces efflorescens]